LFAVFGGVGATALYYSDSMDPRFIDNNVVVVSFEFGKTVSKDHAIIARRWERMARIRAAYAIKSNAIRARQAPMA